MKLVRILMLMLFGMITISIETCLGTPEENWFNAVNIGDLKKMESLKTEIKSVDIQDKDGNTALHTFALKGWIDKLTSKSYVEILLEWEANPNIKNNDGDTALHIAIWKKWQNMPALLINNAQAKKDIQNDVGDTPMHTAASVANLGAIEELCAKGWDISAKNKQGFTPLHLAARFYTYQPVIEKLLINGANTSIQDNNGWTALHWAAWQGMSPIPLGLMAPINVQNNLGNTALHNAATKGHPEVAKDLLDNWANLPDKTIKNKKNQTARDIAKAQYAKFILSNAAQAKSYKEIIELLYNKYMDAEKTDLETFRELAGKTPLFAKDTLDQWVDLLKKLNPNAEIEYTHIDSSGEPINHSQLLSIWIVNNHTASAETDADYRIIETFLDQKPDLLKDVNYSHRNFLHIAARNTNSPQLIKYITEKLTPDQINTLVNAVDSLNSAKPLDYAVHSNNPGAVLCLLAAGADPKVKSNIYIYTITDESVRELLQKPQAEAQAEAKKLLGMAPAEPEPTAKPAPAPAEEKPEEPAKPKKTKLKKSKSKVKPKPIEEPEDVSDSSSSTPVDQLIAALKQLNKQLKALVTGLFPNG